MRYLSTYDINAAKCLGLICPCIVNQFNKYFLFKSLKTLFLIPLFQKTQIFKAGSCIYIIHTHTHTYTHTHTHIYTHTHTHTQTLDNVDQILRGVGHTQLHIHRHTQLHRHTHRQKFKHITNLNERCLKSKCTLLIFLHFKRIKSIVLTTL